MQTHDENITKETDMIYRSLPHGGEDISIIGLGLGSLHNATEEEIEETVDAALNAGVNHIDFIPSNDTPFAPVARAVAGRRDKVRFQVHIGAEYTHGAYGWTTDADLAKREFEARLRTLDTEYADFGFIHCIDEDSDFDAVMKGGIWEYACEMKRQGVIRHLGFSTHSVSIARRFIATGAMDLGMFSINPLYDYTDESEYGKGEANDRHALYREFEAAGVGISVMKAFAGGQLLDAKLSPFGHAASRNACIQYALDRPGVLTVLPGIRGKRDLEDVLSFFDASDSERDYSFVGKAALRQESPSCVYCNHCQPCPEGIEVGLVNKYYDLARLDDELAADHYRMLGTHASDCLGCGHCDARCPFGVAQSERMKEIAAYFGV